MGLEPVTHVLFDMDGLILNTEDIYTTAFQNLTSRYGKDYTYELKLKMMGFQSLETARMAIDELRLPLTVEEFMKESEEQFVQLFPTAELMPGARRLLEHFHKHKVPMALATSSSQKSYEMKTRRHQDVFSLFDHKVFGSSDPEVVKGKPNPDIFIVAAGRFPDKPELKKCLVFEDAINGVLAARAAHMQVVMVPDPRMPRALTQHATLVLDSLADFTPDMFGLPPYDQ